MALLGRYRSSLAIQHASWGTICICPGEGNRSAGSLSGLPNNTFGLYLEDIGRYHKGKRRNDMSIIRNPLLVLLASAIAIGGPCLVFAQTNGADDHHPGSSSATNPPSGMESMMGLDQHAMPGSRMMSKEFQCRMMPGAMGGMSTMAMGGDMMKIMFAIADTDGDGSLSFDEIVAIHKRIFNVIDANKDGQVTPEEVRAFWLQ